MKKINDLNPFRSVHLKNLFENKINLICILALLCGTLKGFVKAVKAFLKPFEAPQRNVK